MTDASLGLVLLNAAVGATAASALGFAAAHLLRARPARVRHAALLAVLVVALAAPALAWVSGRCGLGWLRLRVSEAVPVVSAPTPQADRGFFPVVSAPPPAAPVPYETGSFPTTPPGEVVARFALLWGLVPWLAVLWGAGTLLGLAIVARGMLLARRLSRSVRPPRGEVLAGAIARARDAAGRSFEVGICDRVPVPCTVGLLRPMVVLPSSLEGADGVVAAGVLLHEAAHVARRDAWVGLVQRLVGAVHWWNPLVRGLNASLDAAREEACDDFAVDRTGEGRSLAQALVMFAERLAAGGSVPAGAMVFASGDGWLEGRVRRLMRKEREMMTSIETKDVLRVALVGVALTAWAMMVGVSAQEPPVPVVADAPAGIPEDSRPEGTGWGATVNGLRTRLTCLDPDWTFGRPLRLRLELQNVSDRRTTYDDQQVGVNDSFDVTGPDGRDIPWIGGSCQTRGSPDPIAPGETVVLLESFDIAEKYLLVQLGEYAVRFRGRGGFGETDVPASNSVRLRVGGTPPPEMIVLEKCREHLPARWTISMQRRGPLTFGWMYSPPSGLTVDVVAISISFLSERRGDPSTPTEEYLGQHALGYAYLVVAYPSGEAAEAVWPSYRSALMTALGLGF